ncbi:MAG: type II secretion system F family protein [Pirellulaceae bacterium]
MNTELHQQLENCQRIARLARTRLPLVDRMTASSLTGTGRGNEVEQKLAAGQSLTSALGLSTDALATDPQARILAGCIQAGEKSNSLDATLRGWASMHIENAKAVQVFRTALIYPALLLLTTVASLGLVTWLLIPQYRVAYEMFNERLPSWLVAIVWVREHYVGFIIVLALAALLPLAIFLLRRKRKLKSGLPAENARQYRLQGLVAEVAAIQLRHERPLSEVASSVVQISGGGAKDIETAFSQVQQRQPLQTASNETSLLLSSLHAGVLSAPETIDGLLNVSDHYQRTAHQSDSANARWIPMLVALSVGVVTVLTYVTLIYLPWILLMQRIVSKQAQFEIQ